MKLRDLAIGIFDRKDPNAIKFNKETWFITSMYLDCLSDGLEIKPYKKIIVYTITDREKDQLISRMVDVIGVNQLFDFETYFSKPKNERKQILLDALQKAILTLAQEEGWDINSILDAYNCCVSRKLDYTWLIKDKYFISPSKKFYVGIFCRWDIDKFEVFGIVLDKNKRELKRIKLFETEPHDVVQLGNMGWDRNENHFFLFSQNKKNKWIVNVDE